jgi:hypothetical protein
MAGEEREAEGKVGTGEDGEGLDEDVGDGLILGEVWVELVANWSIVSNRNWSRRVSSSGSGRLSDRANN